MTIEDFDWLVETANIIGNITLKAEQINWLIEQINKLTKERDAAIADVKKLSHAVHDPCCYCKNLVHWDYELNNEPCCTCESDDNWEWRGVQNETN